MQHPKLKLATALQRQISEVEVEQQVTQVAPDPRILRSIFSSKHPLYISIPPKPQL